MNPLGHTRVCGFLECLGHGFSGLLNSLLLFSSQNLQRRRVLTNASPKVLLHFCSYQLDQLLSKVRDPHNYLHIIKWRLIASTNGGLEGFGINSSHCHHLNVLLNLISFLVDGTKKWWLKTTTTLDGKADISVKDEGRPTHIEIHLKGRQSILIMMLKSQ